MLLKFKRSYVDSLNGFRENIHLLVARLLLVRLMATACDSSIETPQPTPDAAALDALIRG